MVSASCSQPMPNGRRCRAPVLRDGAYCFWHEPAKAEEVKEARHLRGLRWTRERTLAGVYDISGLDSILAIRRIVQTVRFAVRGLGNSIPRARFLISGALAAAKLLETGELAERIDALEAAVAQGSHSSGDDPT